MKRLYKSQNNRVFAGVCGGIGEYYDIDPNVVRIITLILIFTTGIFPFLILYIIAAFMLPEKSN